jgi:hypothetical protein
MNNNSEPDRVRANTAAEINWRIDRDSAARVASYRGKTNGEIQLRIDRLEREWDMERWLEMNASALAFTGLLLGLTRNKKWLLLPSIVLPFLFQHAVQGWCPPIPLFRRLGIRTRAEIDREKYALKALRGDFENVRSDPESAHQAAKT